MSSGTFCKYQWWKQKEIQKHFYGCYGGNMKNETEQLKCEQLPGHFSLWFQNLCRISMQMFIRNRILRFP